MSNEPKNRPTQDEIIARIRAIGPQDLEELDRADQIEDDEPYETDGWDYLDGYDDEDPYGWAELEDLRAVPPRRRPEDMPPVRSQADLHRHWRALMGELGFAQSRLYLQFFTIDGRCTPLILDITDLPDLPDDRMADALMRFCSEALDHLGQPGMRVGILYARPGGRLPRTADLAWARLVTEGARRHGVPILPVHVANDEEVTVVTPDELVRPA
jgi:hypothetical protein